MSVPERLCIDTDVLKAAGLLDLALLVDVFWTGSNRSCRSWSW